MRVTSDLFSVNIFTPAVSHIPTLIRNFMAVFMPTHIQSYFQRLVGKQTWEFTSPRLEINTVS